MDLKTVELDTAYEVETTKPPATPGEEAPVVKQTKYCDLPKGTVLLLVFVGDRDIPFTTYRKYSQRAWEKFEKMAVKKEKFDIVLNETAN